MRTTIDTAEKKIGLISPFGEKNNKKTIAKKNMGDKLYVAQEKGGGGSKIYAQTTIKTKLLHAGSLKGKSYS